VGKDRKERGDGEKRPLSALVLDTLASNNLTFAVRLWHEGRRDPVTRGTDSTSLSKRVTRADLTGGAQMDVTEKITRQKRGAGRKRNRKSGRTKLPKEVLLVPGWG